jgi:cytochrome P450
MHITDAHFAHLLQQEGGRLSKGRINPVEDLRILPFWIVADVLYGELSVEMKSKLEGLIGVREVLFGHVIQGGLARFAISKYFPTKTNKELRDFKRRWAEFNELALAGCKKEDALGVQMYDAMKRGSLSREHMLQTLDEMLFANLDVTIGGISWNLLFLAENEKFQGEVREEIKLARQRNWVEYLASSSTLLSAGILESARLKPLAPFSVPQSAPTDRIVGGFLVPAGTNFIVDSYALNVRRSFWGDDKEQYRPWRFMGKKASEIRYQYWRFGFGPRQCLGKRTADLILRILLAHLIENYRLGLDEKSRWDKNPTTWITHPNTDIMCKQIASVG